MNSRYRARPTACHILCSRGSVGSWYDDAPMEGFCSTLKSEPVHHCHYRTRGESRFVLLYRGLLQPAQAALIAGL